MTVRGRDEWLDAALTGAERSLRVAVDLADRTAAVRTMYKRIGLDPTKTRPSSEALLRRVKSDSARTMVTTATRRTLVVIFAPVSVTRAELEEVVRLTTRRVGEFCRA